MAYSRWGSSRWYTFWAGQDIATENRDTARFKVGFVAAFTAAELQSDIEHCLTIVMEKEESQFRSLVSDEEREELRGYMLKFLADVDKAYPLPIT